MIVLFLIFFLILGIPKNGIQGKFGTFFRIFFWSIPIMGIFSGIIINFI